MAIQPDKLELRFEARFSGDVLIHRYEIFHKDWVPDTVLASGNVSRRVRRLDRLTGTDAGLQAQLRSKLANAREAHRPLGVAGGQSVHDTNLIWEGWEFYQLPDGRWQADHPLSGTFTGQMENMPVGRTLGILTVVLPPPAWAWADSVASGKLRVQCIAVADADHYIVYDDRGSEFVVLGSTSSASLTTLNVAAGVYNVRIAAVDSGDDVGILSVPAVVEVG